MKARTRTAALVMITCLAIPAPVWAQYSDLENAERTDDTHSSSSSGEESRFGVGIEAVLSGLFASTELSGIPLGGGGGATFIFDARQFRIEGILGLLFVEDLGTSFGLAARFLWVLHSTRSSDLGLGAGIGVSHTEISDSSNDVTLFHAEGLVQIRFFVVENVALHGGLGLGLAVGDGTTILSIGGQLLGRIGLSYFF